jgi:DNA-binding NarL/FixJ family response regulator
MRIVLVGPPEGRAALGRALAGADIVVIGEARTIEAARRLGLDPDAWLVAPDRDDAPSVTGSLVEPLTPREIQVLELVAEGLPNKLIAKRLEISDQTVKFHVASICGKLGAANRTEAVRKAIRNGLIAV